MKCKFAFGTSNFKEIIENNNFFVDKSLFIKKVIKDTKVALITRPRRFGKSLNFSMLRYFFDINEDSSSLFKGLNISKEKDCLEHMNKYPVVELDFKAILGNNWHDIYNGIKRRIGTVYKKHQNSVWDILSTVEKKEYLQIIDGKEDFSGLSESILNLTRYLEAKYKEKVVVLIDEYDAVMAHMYNKPKFDNCMSIFRGIYENALKGNTSIHQALITGIMRFDKEGLFSGLNNVAVYGPTHERYGKYFGFTEEEIKPIIIDSGLEYEKAKEYYNGYNFGGSLVYNPWSVLNYIHDRKVDYFWRNTTCSTLIREIIKKGGPEVKYALERMLNGESVEIELEENVNLRELDEKDIYSLLFQSGYLTYEEINKVRRYKLPNKEVSNFISSLVKNMEQEMKISSTIERLFLTKDWKVLEEVLQSSVMEIMSYFDVPKKKETEAMYHMLLLGLLAKFHSYSIRSNIETGLGRADILMKRKDKKEYIVIELKAGNRFSKLHNVVKEALDQIIDKKYGQDLDGEIIKMGIGFVGKNLKLEVIQ